MSSCRAKTSDGLWQNKSWRQTFTDCSRCNVCTNESEFVMLKIYLAGPFFNDKQIATIEAIENEFDKYGFDYFSPRKSGGVKRYSVAYTNENFGLDIMLKESVDAHVVCEPDLRSFCGIMAGNWDAPVGKEGLPEWQDNQARREKIFSQFQNFNSDK